MKKENISNAVELEMLEKTSIEQLCEFLRNEFETNASLRQRFADFMNKPATKQEASEKFEIDLINKIEDVIEGAEGRYGFIDYHSASRFDRKMMDVLEHIQDEAPTQEVCVTLQLYIAQRLGEISIDDSDGVITGLMLMILDDFHCIYENEDWREMLFEKCMEFVTDYGNKEGFCAQEIEDFVLQFEGETFAKRIEEYLDKKIKALPKEIDDWSFRHNMRRYVVKMLQAKATQGADEKQLLDFAKTFWQSSDARQFFVERYIAEEHYVDAISLLEEGIQLDEKWAGIVSGHQKQLKDLYLKTGQTDKYINTLRTLIESSWDAELELFDELKSHYTAAEWEIEREKVFKSKSKYVPNLAKLLHHEGLTERLAELVLDEDNSFWNMLDEYAAELPKKYIPQILSLYEKTYIKQAANASKRSEYERLVLTDLKNVLKIEGGKELTDRLTRQWLEQYKRRPAFCKVIRTYRMDNGMAM